MLIACTFQLRAQVDHLELGLRLRAFERNLAARTDRALRADALRELDTAVRAFFGLDRAAVARALAGAEAALRGRPFTDAEAFAHRLHVQLHARLAAAEGTVPFTVALAWRDGERQPPAGLSLAVRTEHGGAQATSVALDELPAQHALSLRGVPPGDYTVVVEVREGEQVLLRRDLGVSVAAELDARLARLRDAAGLPGAGAGAKGQDANEESEPDAAPAAAIESATLRAHVRTLEGMRRRRGEDTVLPGERLLREAEALAAARGAPFYGPERPGEFWWRVPAGERTVAVRLAVPADMRAAEQRPLLLALHGAGGSENLFFDGYGDGVVVRTASERGWFLCAPRQVFGDADLPALVDALAARWPIDRSRVLLVGHSMGAMQAVAAASRAPDRFAAVAALGGGGRPAGTGLPPFLVGVGARDFARAGASALHGALQRLGASSTLRVYDDVEHLAIVQWACADVFAFFDGALANGR